MNTRVMLLQSSDGEDYILPVIPPAALSVDEAIMEVTAIIDNCKAAHPEDWSLEDLTPMLESAGWDVPAFFQGPQWD